MPEISSTTIRSHTAEATLRPNLRTYVRRASSGLTCKPGVKCIQYEGRPAHRAPVHRDLKVIVKHSSTPAKVGVRHGSVSNMPPILLPNPTGGYFE